MTWGIGEIGEIGEVAPYGGLGGLGGLRGYRGYRGYRGIGGIGEVGEVYREVAPYGSTQNSPYSPEVQSSSRTQTADPNPTGSPGGWTKVFHLSCSSLITHHSYLIPIPLTPLGLCCIGSGVLPQLPQKPRGQVQHQIRGQLPGLPGMQEGQDRQAAARQQEGLMMWVHMPTCVWG